MLNNSFTSGLPSLDHIQPLEPRFRPDDNFLQYRLSRPKSSSEIEGKFSSLIDGDFGGGRRRHEGPSTNRSVSMDHHIHNRNHPGWYSVSLWVGGVGLRLHMATSRDACKLSA